MKLFAFLSAVGALAGAAMAGGVSGSGIVVLDKSASGALSMTGNSSIKIPTLGVYVNSSSSTAVKTVGTALLDAPFMYVVGGWQFNGNSHCTGTVAKSVAPYDDPLAGLKWPSAAGQSALAAQSVTGGAKTFSPGYYAGGISITGNAQVVFNPGVYLIGGSGLKLTSGSVSGEGVTFVMLAGKFDIAGSSGFHISAPSTGDMADVVMCQPAANTNDLKLAGGSEMVINGAIYAPGATVSLVGNSTIQGQGPKMGDLVVSNKLALAGTSQITVGQAPSAAIDLPTMPLYD